jgi:hypothetical protein
MNIDNPEKRSADRDMEAVFGRPPLYLREGGSIPI